MKKTILIALAFTTVLASCGQERSSTDNGGYKAKIVLGAFNDMVSSSTLDESQLSNLPKIIDFSDEMTPSRNQSDRGTCTIFSTMGLIEGAIKKDLGVDVNLSEEYMNYTSKKTGIYNTTEGSVVSENIAAVYKGGLLLENDWAYQSSWFKKSLPCEEYKSTDSNAPKICFSHNSPNNKVLAQTIDPKNIKFFGLKKDTNEIIKHLANTKRPLAMSVNVNFNGWSKTGETDYNEKLREECLTTPANCGGHSIILTGYDMNKKVFMFKNSWGRSWGQNGYGTIPFEAVDKYVTGTLYYAKVTGEVKIPDPISSRIYLSSFNVSTSIEEDKSIKVNIQSEINETNGKMLFISSYLVKKHNDNSGEFPNDQNTQQIRLFDLEEKKVAGDEYIRALSYLVPKEENNLVITADDRPGMFITSSMFSIPTVRSLVESTDYELSLRTTIYVHDDDVGFRTLKRTYTPLY